MLVTDYVRIPRPLTRQLQAIVDRYPDSSPPSVDHLINLLAAPTVFRILFSNAPLTVQELHALIELALQG